MLTLSPTDSVPLYELNRNKFNRGAHMTSAGAVMAGLGIAATSASIAEIQNTAVGVVGGLVTLAGAAIFNLGIRYMQRAYNEVIEEAQGDKESEFYNPVRP